MTSNYITSWFEICPKLINFKFFIWNYIEFLLEINHNLVQGWISKHFVRLDSWRRRLWNNFFQKLSLGVKSGISLCTTSWWPPNFCVGKLYLLGSLLWCKLGFTINFSFLVMVYCNRSNNFGLWSGGGDNACQLHVCFATPPPLVLFGYAHVSYHYVGRAINCF